MARKVKLKSDAAKKGGLAKFLFYLLLLSFFGVTIYILLFSRYLAITNISVIGLDNLKEDEITQEIRWSLEGKFFNIIERDNLFFVRPAYYENILSQKFKKIDSVEISRKFPGTIVVNIKEKKLAMIFSTGGRFFILDDKGKAFEEINQDSPEYANNDLVLVTDTGNNDINPQGIIFDPNHINFINDVRRRIENELNINLAREFNTPNRISGDLRVATKEGWSIYFDANLDPKKEAGMLKAVLDEKIPKDQTGNLEYIDLRVDNKVFYKFRDGSATEAKQEDEKSAAEQPKTEEKEEKKKK